MQSMSTERSKNLWVLACDPLGVSSRAPLLCTATAVLPGPNSPACSAPWDALVSLVTFPSRSPGGATRRRDGQRCFLAAGGADWWGRTKHFGECDGTHGPNPRRPFQPGQNGLHPHQGGPPSVERVDGTCADRRHPGDRPDRGSATGDRLLGR